MNQITKDDFVRMLQLSKASAEDDSYDAEAATNAKQDMQKKNYSVEDQEGIAKLRAKQQAFSNQVRIPTIRLSACLVGICSDTGYKKIIFNLLQK